MTFNLVHCHYVDKNDEHLAYATMGVEKPDYEDPYHPFVDFPASMQQNTRAVEKRVLDGLSVRSRGLVPSDQLVTELVSMESILSFLVSTKLDLTCPNHPFFF